MDYISSILSALYDAKKDAKNLLALKEDLRLTEAELDLYKIYTNKLEERNNALLTIVTTLIHALPPNVAQNLAVWLILLVYGTGAQKSREEAK